MPVYKTAEEEFHYTGAIVAHAHEVLDSFARVEEAEETTIKLEDEVDRAEGKLSDFAIDVQKLLYELIDDGLLENTNSIIEFTQRCEELIK